MERTPLLRLGALIVTVLVVFFGACTKAEKRGKSSGQQPSDPLKDIPDDPCLRFQLDDEDHDDDDEDHHEDDEDHDHDEEHSDEDDEDEDGIGSKSSSTDCGGGDPTIPEPTDPKPGSGGNGSWNAGPGKDGCEEEGKAWIAVNGGGPAVCGAPLVKWCCSEAEIAKRFPQKASELQAKFDGVIAKGMKLYHCSEEDGKTTFHFAKGKSGGAEYWKIYISKLASKDGDTKGDNCPNVTMADMGFDKEGDKEDPIEDSIPESIGELIDTSKAGLVSFLKGNEYKNWTNFPAVRTTEDHGKIRTYFNSKLKDSLTAAKDEHDVGSIAVQEVYKSDGTTLDGYSVLAKHKAGEGKDTWFFYQVTGAPDFADVKAYGVGAPSDCVSCHKSGTDFISSSLP